MHSIGAVVVHELMFAAISVTVVFPAAAGQGGVRGIAEDEAACALLTKADVEQLLGTSVGRITALNGTRFSRGCIFISRERSSVSVYLVRSPVALDARAEIRKTKEQLPAARVREVAGLGDAAMLSEYPNAVQVGVYAGKGCLMLSAYGVSPTSARTHAIEHLARKALAKLPERMLKSDQ